ncbi:MAG: hypothetical protein KJ057_01095 [Phycisphaerae bacterium]|nr:hypothetical protein [Phycisphaerae bacterium]MCL4717051.1 hypothetical protein [Phycisphaerae bacterium]NUQ09267.1 hypothetical protein [Phycisphaerae bacterium]
MEHMQDRSRIRRAAHVGWAMGVLVSTPAAAQEPPATAPSLERLAKTAEGLAQWGPWEEQAAWIDRSMTRVWERNGWNDEPDRFALETMRDVAAIPPWRIFERLDFLTSRARERYDLTDAQAANLKQSIMTETATLFARHAPTIVRQINEQTRLRLEAEDDEGLMKEIQGNVARWMQDTEPLHRDAMEAFARVTSAFESGLTPEQKQKFAADRRMIDKLTRHGEQLRAEGLAGRFDPEAWGMSREEFTGWLREISLHGPGNARRGEGAVAAAPPRWLAHVPSTWRYYVEDATQRFSFDAAQIKAADSILAELAERADRHLLAQRKVLDTVDPAARASHEAMKPVLDLFESLKTRLDALKRREQKDDPSSGTPRPRPGGGTP